MKTRTMLRLFTTNVLIILFTIALPVSSYAAGGCCKGHGGVASCNAEGQKVCKDNTISPTCACKAKKASKSEKHAKSSKTSAVAPVVTKTSYSKNTKNTSTTTGTKGCCSRHGGIAACDVSTGFQKCKDGTDSPSCKCQ